MKEQTAKVLSSLRFPFIFILMMWIVQVIKFATGVHLTFLGIFPRELIGLKGVITAPLIHGDWQHLISNTVPMAALCGIIFLFYRRVAVKTFLLTYILTGLSVWLFARPVWHIGASGVVYGLLAFVFWTGVFRRSFKSIAISLAILVMYSGYFLGVVPGQPGVSWESHLYGGLVGIIVAYLFKNTVEADEINERPELEDEYDERYLLPRDTFEKTLAERRREMEQQQRAQQSYWRRTDTF